MFQYRKYTLCGSRRWLNEEQFLRFFPVGGLLTCIVRLRPRSDGRGACNLSRRLKLVDVELSLLLSQPLVLAPVLLVVVLASVSIDDRQFVIPTTPRGTGSGYTTPHSAAAAGRGRRKWNCACAKWQKRGVCLLFKWLPIIPREIPA